MEDLISSVIDSPAVEKEIANVEKRLADLARVIETYPKASIFQNATNAKELVAANNQVSASLEQMRTKTIALNQAQSQVQNLKQYNDYKAALASISVQQKQLKKDVEDGTITADQYRFKLTQLTEAQFKYRQSLSDVTKEIKTQQGLNFTVPNSIGEAQAQNKILVTQRNNVDVNNTAKIAELNTLIDRNNKLIDDNNDKLGKQKINIGNYASAFTGAFDVVNKEVSNLGDQLNRGGISQDEYTKKSQLLAKAQTVLSQTFSSTTEQQKAYKETATQIGLVYGKNSDVFKNFSAQVKEGSNQVKSLQQQSEGASAGSNKLVTGFKSFYGILRNIANLIPGLGIGSLILLLITPLETLGASIVKLFSSIDAGRIKTAALNEINEKAIDIYNKEASQVGELAAVTKDNSLSLKDRQSALEQLIAISPDYLRGLTLENINTDEGRKILDKFNDALKRKGELEAAQTVNTESNKAVANLNAEKQALIDLAKAGKVNFNDLSETQQKFLGNFNTLTANFKFTASLFNTAISKKDIQTVLNGIDDAIKDATVKAGASLSIYKDKFKANIAAGDDSVKGLIENLQEQINKLQKIQPTLLTPEAITANVTQIKKLQDEIDKLLGKRETERNKQLQELKDHLNTEFEIYKISQEHKISLFDKDVNNENIYYLKKLTALDEFVKASNELIKNQEANDIAAKEREAARETQRLNEEKKGKDNTQVARLNENIKTVDANLQQDLNLIRAKALDDSVKLTESAADKRQKITDDELKAEAESYKEFQKILAGQDEAGDKRIAEGFKKREQQEKEFAEEKLKLENDLKNARIDLAIKTEDFIFSLAEASFERQQQ
jgi:hypothetical protein